MIIAFAGHSLVGNEIDVEKRLTKELSKLIDKNHNLEFYLGCYGGFDLLAVRCCRKLKENYESIKLSFITPYMDKNYLKRAENRFDEIIYPELETVPKKFAIIKRNEWIAKNCDLLICFVDYGWGGAFRTYSYAKKLNKKIINLGRL